MRERAWPLLENRNAGSDRKGATVMRTTGAMCGVAGGRPTRLEFCAAAVAATALEDTTIAWTEGRDESSNPEALRVARVAVQPLSKFPTSKAFDLLGCCCAN